MSKNSTLNEWFEQNINPKIQVDIDISTQIKDIQQKLDKHKVNIDPEITRSIQRLRDSYKKSTESFVNALKEAVSINSSIFLNKPLQLAFESINKTINNIDFTRLREGLRLRLEAYEKSMHKYDKDLWAVDRGIFDLLDQFHDGEPSDEIIEQYVEESLNSYIDYFKNEEIYRKYTLILEQSHYAFKSKQYALAAYPLFSVIEGLIGTTFEDYEIDITLKPRLKRNKNKLYFKLVDYVENTEDELAVNLLFFRRVFKVFEEIFKPSREEHPENINRNWIMHGAYNYESITKKDVLKLFQLVKAAEVVKNLSFENEKKEAS